MAWRSRPASAELIRGSQSRFDLFTRGHDVLDHAQGHVGVVGHGFANAGPIFNLSGHRTVLRCSIGFGGFDKFVRQFYCESRGTSP